MSLHRFYSQEPLPSQGSFYLNLSAEEQHHFKVLRIKNHEHFALFDKAGKSIEVELLNADEDNVEVKVIQKLLYEKLPHITLVQALSKSDHMTQTIRQCTELGIEAIIPFVSKRSVVRLNESSREKKHERFCKIALAAAKQSGRNSAPLINKILEPQQLKDRLSSQDCILLAWEENRKNSLSIKEALKPFDAHSHISIIVGPEGGFSASEIEAFHAMFQGRLKTVKLGHLILRTETAAVVSVALASASLGGLGFRD